MTTARLRSSGGKVHLERKQTFHLINVPKDSFHHVKEHLLIYRKIVKLVKFERKKPREFGENRVLSLNKVTEM